MLLAGGGFLAYKLLSQRQGLELPEGAVVHQDVDGRFIGLQSIVRQLEALDDTRDNMLIALNQGQRAVNDAESMISELPWIGNSRDIGKSAIAHARGGLDYHRNQLENDQSPTYAKADDLKKRVVEAFIAHNEVVAGTQAASEHKAQFWADVWQNIKDLPVSVVGALGNAIGSGVAGIFGSGVRGVLGGLVSDPIGLAALALVGYGVYRKVRA